MHATIHEHRMWYEMQGEGGAPVVLVMGFGMSGRAWAPQVRALQRQHRVVIFDNRGIGESESSRVPYGFAQLADDAVALLDHLDIPSAHVVGVSMGGMVSQHIALRHPGRVRSLSLIATHPGGNPLRFLPTLRGLRHFVKANTSEGSIRFSALRQLLYPPEFLARSRPEEDFDAESMERFAVPADPYTRMQQLRSILRHDVTRQLPTLRVPTLVVRPGRDILVRPAHSDRIAALIPGARVLRCDDAGHGVTSQCAEEVNRALLAHFADADEAAVSAAA